MATNRQTEEQTDACFEFEGEWIETVRDVLIAMDRVYARGDTVAAQRLRAEMFRVDPYADENMGYLTGYFEDSGSVAEFFDVTHPIFGRVTPSIGDALEAGMLSAVYGIHSLDELRRRAAADREQEDVDE